MSPPAGYGRRPPGRRHARVPARFRRTPRGPAGMLARRCHPAPPLVLLRPAHPGPDPDVSPPPPLSPSLPSPPSLWSPGVDPARRAMRGGGKGVRVVGAGAGAGRACRSGWSGSGSAWRGAGAGLWWSRHVPIMRSYQSYQRAVISHKRLSVMYRYHINIPLSVLSTCLYLSYLRIFANLRAHVTRYMCPSARTRLPA